MSKAERRIILACLISFISGAVIWHFYYTIAVAQCVPILSGPT